MFGGSEAAGEKAELLGAADGTGYGWLAEEDKKRRKTEEARKESERKRERKAKGKRERKGRNAGVFLLIGS